MRAAAALPTRRDEAWRYSDLDALARVWPRDTVEHVTVPVGQAIARQIVQMADAEAVVVQNLNIVLEAGARCDIHILNAGGQFGRIAIDVTLHAGAAFTLGAVQLGTGKQTVEIVTTVRHVEPDATSRQTVRSILAKQATGSYLGKVAVSRGAQKTDSVQSVKAMLLDRTATANAKPELEIYADDVKCAHGATVGELDKTAMFYLASRGLPPQAAQTLLLQAFIAEVFADVADVQAKEQLETAALAALEAMA